MSERIYDLAESKLSGDHKKKKSKKEVHEVRTRKAKSGGYIHEHHHTDPVDHPMEEHTSPDAQSAADHIMQALGGQSPAGGDAGADPSAAAAPAGGGGAAPVPNPNVGAAPEQ